MPQVMRAIRPMFKSGRWRIFRDDIVVLRSGPEKGQTGRVLEVLKDDRVPQVLVEGLNLRKKKIYNGEGVEDFFVVSMEAPIHYSQVGVLDPTTNRPVRTGFRYLSDGTQVRIGKGRAASGNIIPIAIQEEPNPKMNLCGKKDTTKEDTLKVTYDPTARFPFRLPFTPSSRGASSTISGWRTFSTSTSSSSSGSTSSSCSQHASPADLKSLATSSIMGNGLRTFNCIRSNSSSSRNPLLAVSSMLVSGSRAFSTNGSSSSSQSASLLDMSAPPLSPLSFPACIMNTSIAARGLWMNLAHGLKTGNTIWCVPALQ